MAIIFEELNMKHASRAAVVKYSEAVSTNSECKHCINDKT